MKKVIVLMDTNNTENLYLKMNDFINKDNDLVKLNGCLEVPFDTTINELEEAIIQNRSKQIEKEYAETFEELS